MSVILSDTHLHIMCKSQYILPVPGTLSTRIALAELRFELKTNNSMSEDHWNRETPIDPVSVYTVQMSITSALLHTHIPVAIASHTDPSMVIGSTSDALWVLT